MNREILFRAWIIKEKYMMSHEELMNQFDDIRGVDRKYDIFKDDNLVIEQYTGLKDKHGKRIFEGDKVKLAGLRNATIKFKDGAFGYKGLTPGCYIFFAGNNLLPRILKDIEIIGNIHDQEATDETDNK